MKRLLLAGALAAVFIPTAYAEEGISFGLKAGLLSIENDNDAAINVGGVLSVGFSGSPIGVEGELNTSVSDGSFNRVVDYSVTQVGAFATVSLPAEQSVNVKLRLGAMNTSVDPSVGSSDDDTDLAYGVGGNVGALELSWTRSQFYESDVDFLAIGYNF
ncbi:MAG: hypothetical protein P1U67_04795 [Alcanivoracaceae bacterium]|nr:hypothetical protein [Alcanivoracaceae bacterium]